jgi:hypothetical protein
MNPIMNKRIEGMKQPRQAMLISLCGMVTTLALIISIAGCYEEEFTTDPGDGLVFSTDTLSFDTVLTEVSTVTRYFKVYNPHDRFIRIETVEIIGPGAAFFRLNVDGSSGDVIRDIQINPNDSIYVFVESTIDPDQPASVSPFVIEADVRFTVNTQEPQVKLIAWGQNANYIPGPDNPNRILILTCDLGTVTWDDPRPYVIYGTLLIDSCKLILPPGARLYIHGGIANNELGIYNEGLIYALPNGQLEVSGTVENPVIIRDDRIEPDHDGEWAGIRLGPSSGPHTFSHMRMSSALVGIYADSASTVSVDHSSIAFTAGPGIYARHATATITNSLFHDNGSQAIALTFGGTYKVDYCTIANYGNTTEGLLLNNFYCTDPLCSEGALTNPLHARVNNCIVVGSSTDELWMIDATMPSSGFFDVLINNSLVVTDELIDNFPNFFSDLCINCIEYQFGDTLFRDLPMMDFHLDTNSVAERKGIPLPGIVDDLDGVARDAVMPDVGCYEFVD